MHTTPVQGERTGLQANVRGKGLQPGSGLVRFAWLVVAYNVLVILWGTVVRATGSGNGCGDHWPLCQGTVMQRWQTAASVIEFAHRATAGVDTVAIAGLLVWTWRATPKRHLARVFMATAAVLTFNEALLGALLVKLGLTAENHSPERAVYLSFHLANTLLLLGALALTAHFLGRENGRMRGAVVWRHRIFVVSGLLATLLVGVSGSLAALGDTLYPARTLAAAFAQDLSPGSNWILHLRWIHPALALLAGAWMLVLAMRAWMAGERVWGVAVAALLWAQLSLGVADVLLLAPTALQVAHLLGADVLWISLVVLSVRLTVRPIGCTGGMRCGGAASSQTRSGVVETISV